MSSRVNGATVAELDGDHEIQLTAPALLANAPDEVAGTPG
jgi:hypothetical protein